MYSKYILQLMYTDNVVMTTRLQSNEIFDNGMFIRRVWRYQRGNQNLYIEEEQTTRWPKDTKGVIRICI